MHARRDITVSARENKPKFEIEYFTTEDFKNSILSEDELNEIKPYLDKMGQSFNDIDELRRKLDYISRIRGNAMAVKRIYVEMSNGDEEAVIYDPPIKFINAEEQQGEI